ncbi:hypothetical protein BBJ28_00000219 [Nothophytophthora sp. Chile5]|nr:hypothetical protein BBJ28_00000219 [Nothophytophthora sp. Chile5]
MNRYEMLERLGDGSFGEVSRARSLKTQEIVAVKKIKALFPTWEECLQLRELKSLRVLRHENIVQLKEVIRDKEELYFVFEYMQTSLFRVMRSLKHQGGGSGSTSATDEGEGSGSASSSPPLHPWFSEAQIRSIMYQLFCGLAHMHKHGFFHRDIKPENLLCHDETLKIADLGQAREIRSRPPFTDYVATRWYRAPELLLRSATYNSPIDMWACGCIMVELLLCTPLFPGTSEADQFYRICKVLGTPTKDMWPEGVAMALHMQLRLPKCASVPWNRVLSPGTPPAAIQLVQDLLQYDPSRRITAAQALQHRFFDQQVTRPMLTSPPPEDEVAVLSLRCDHKTTAVGNTSNPGLAGYSTKKTDKTDDTYVADSSGRWGGAGGVPSRRELPDWAAKTHEQTQQIPALYTSARGGVAGGGRWLNGEDDRADAKPVAANRGNGGAIWTSTVKKCSSSNAIANVGSSDASGFYSSRKYGPEDETNSDKTQDDGSSEGSMLQDLLDELLA